MHIFPPRKVQKKLIGVIKRLRQQKPMSIKIRLIRSYFVETVHVHSDTESFSQVYFVLRMLSFLCW